jgi:hypothetical protein
MKDNKPTWNPINGKPKKRRVCNVKTSFSKNRANHRNEILKTWAKRLESAIIPKVPENYVSPFEKNKCVYCLSTKIGPSGDEFRPITQRGRINIINCIPCCGMCNSSKQDKCGDTLIQWIKDRTEINIELKAYIIEWYQQYEQYMLIPLDTIDVKNRKTYAEIEEGLDERLNKIYEEFS